VTSPSAGAANIAAFIPADFLYRPAWVRGPVPWSERIGVQMVAAPWREDIALRVAHALERGVSSLRPRQEEVEMGI